MNKQFSRNSYRTKKHSGWRGYRIATLLILLIAIIGGGTVTYQYHRQPQRFPALQAFSTHVSVWWAERKARIENKMANSNEKLNKVAVVKAKAKKSQPESLHFEFYTMLPNDGVEPSEERVKSIFNQASLEREFAQAATKTSYIIQTGIYSNATTAENMRQTLSTEGLASKVVKAYIDERLVYRIQVGPYTDQDKISAAQSKLAARGIHGALRKMGDKIA
jgi:cell division protein FtsN